MKINFLLCLPFLGIVSGVFGVGFHNETGKTFTNVMVTYKPEFPVQCDLAYVLIGKMPFALAAKLDSEKGLKANMPVPSVHTFKINTQEGTSFLIKDVVVPSADSRIIIMREKAGPYFAFVVAKGKVPKAYYATDVSVEDDMEEVD